MSTDVLAPFPVTGARPLALPAAGGDVAILFAGDQNGEARLMLRRRLQNPLVGDAPLPIVAAPRAALLLGPNPLRAGQSLRVWSDAPSSNPMLDVFDAGGRRVASVRLERFGARAEARLPGDATASWPPGMYFARTRGPRAERARLTVVR